jgi:hypothetical protein
VFRLGSKLTTQVAALLLSTGLLQLQAQTTTNPGVTISVTSSANPSVFADPVTFTIAVTAPTSTAPVPTGTVTARVAADLPGLVFLGEGALDGSGKAVITVPQLPGPLATPPWGLPAGSDAITFSYSGDTTYKVAQSIFTQFVKKADTTSTAAENTSSQPLVLTATVSIDEPTASSSPFVVPGDLSNSAPTGTVQFLDGNPLTASVRLLGTATLEASGLFTSTATLTVTTAPESLYVVYGGDSNYNGSVSPHVVGTGKGTVNLTVTSSAAQPTFAEPVTFNIVAAPASSGTSAPSGTVTASLLGLFNLGSATLDGTGKGSLTVPAGAATILPWGLPAGSNAITFSYSGDANYSPAQTLFTQMVDKAATATTATVSPSSTTITATVSIDEPSVSPIAFALPGANAAVSNPTGMVQFLNDNTVVGTAPLTPNGHFQSAATLMVAQPFASSAVLTAVYNGDANYTGSTSPPATVPNLPSVTVGVQSSVNPATFAEPVTLTITVAPAVQGNVIPTGNVQAAVLGSDIIGAATLDSTGSATITVPSQIPVPNSLATLPWGLATGSNVIIVSYSGDSNFAPGETAFTQVVNQADTSTTVVPAPVATSVNEAVYVATVSIDEASVSKTAFRIPAPGNLSTSPTGNVDFYDGTTLIQSVALTPSSLFQSEAILRTTTMPASVRAVYNGDVNYKGSSSQSVGLGNGAVTVTLASSANPATYGAALTIQATVTPATPGPTPTGTLQFFDGTQNLNWTATLDSSGHGVLQLPIPEATPLVCALICPPPADVLVLGGGSNSITAQYSGDVNYAAATSSPLAQQITKAPTSTTVSVVAELFGVPTGSGLTATVADTQPPSGGPYHFSAMTASGVVEGNPTGTVTFYSASTSIGTGNLMPSFTESVASTAALNTSNTTASGSFSASYPGDANFQPSSSPIPIATSVSLTASPNPSNTFQSVSLTATISSASATPAPTGQVFFLDGSTVLGIAVVSGDKATLTTIFTTAGAHSLTAKYSGDAYYQGSTSAVYTQTVNSTTTPTDTMELAVSTAKSVFGQHVILFARVVGNVSTPPTGTVNFFDGSMNIGSENLEFSQAYLVVTFAVGTHSITASWAGDSNWPAATSAAVTLTVARAASRVFLTSFNSEWTAVVMAAPPGEGTPTGSVQFVDTVTQAVLATANLTGGIATVTLTSVTDPLQAVYSGDSNFKPSKSRTPSEEPTHRRR